MPRRHLPLLCPSLQGPGLTLVSEPCTRAACTWWDGGSCSAAADVVDTYAAHLDKDALPAPCPKADACTWHQAGPCPPRRLGMLCEHVGGVWNTFDMAPPEEW